MTAIFASYSIGYTTSSWNARSSLYSSDIGKMINGPVLRVIVNGDYHLQGMVSSFQESLCVHNSDNPRKILQERWISHFGIGIFQEGEDIKPITPGRLLKELCCSSRTSSLRIF